MIRSHVPLSASPAVLCRYQGRRTNREPRVAHSGSVSLIAVVIASTQVSFVVSRLGISIRTAVSLQETVIQCHQSSGRPAW